MLCKMLTPKSRSSSFVAKRSRPLPLEPASRLQVGSPGVVGRSLAPAVSHLLYPVLLGLYFFLLPFSISFSYYLVVRRASPVGWSGGGILRRSTRQRSLSIILKRRTVQESSPLRRAVAAFSPASAAAVAQCE